MERKLATVLFVDLVDSTGFVTASDPEVVRRRVTRFFEHVSECVELHGGIVEKFAGDAVMAAFGIPQAHDDDAERAIRAALSVRASNDTGLQMRMGVESGEVVTEDTESTFATGEAVNLAARLQQAAEPEQILVGPSAHRLTLGAIEVEEIGPVKVRGREEPVWAWAALSADGRPAARVPVTPLVGRAHELELLDNTFARAVRDRRAHLFTIYGEPGVGKSRLSNEFLGSLESTTVLHGRCLPYGESITYWPLAEMVKGAADIADDDPLDVAIEKLRECCPAEAVADLLGLATGVLEAVHGERSQQEISWAAREWAQLMAQTQPLILVFEDIHWAEEPLLELIEHMTEWVKDGALMILCLARPELLDIRSDWGGGRVRSTSIELEPLREEDGEVLIAALAEEITISDETRRRLLDKTGGNPLFLEEVMLTVNECGEEEAAAGIPDTVQALIAARIDRLQAPSKAVLQRASVIGRTFWAGAIEFLAEEDGTTEEAIEDLLLRDLVIGESRSSLKNESAYRFKHVLIRDVAYSSLTKWARAKHHARFADWLKERAGDELLEIRAHHLDHAASLLAELDGSPPTKLAHEAAGVLEEAGRRALAREANQAARHLFLRSVELESTLQRRYLAAKAAWRLDDLPAVAREMEAVREEAAQAGEKTLEGKALTAIAEMVLMREADPLRASELAEQALALIDDDPPARFDALRVAWTAAYWVGHLADAERYVVEQLELARTAGRKDLESVAVLTWADTYSARLDLETARTKLERARDLAEESGAITARGGVYFSWGKLYSMQHELEQAEEAFAEAERLYSEAGAVWAVARTLNMSAWVAWESGDVPKAEKRFRESIRLLKPLGDRATLCESQRGLAELLIQRGRVEEAERFALEARETVGPLDVTSRATTAGSLALVRAAQGRDADAEALFRDGLAEVADTDFRHIENELLVSFVRFMRDQGRDDEADQLEERRAGLFPAAEKSSARIA